ARTNGCAKVRGPLCDGFSAVRIRDAADSDRVPASDSGIGRRPVWHEGDAARRPWRRGSRARVAAARGCPCPSGLLRAELPRVQSRAARCTDLGVSALGRGTDSPAVQVARVRRPRGRVAGRSGGGRVTHAEAGRAGRPESRRALPSGRLLHGRPRAGIGDRARVRSRLVRGPGHGEYRRARRVRAADPARRTAVPRSSDRRPHGFACGREHRCGPCRIRALRSAAHTRRRRTRRRRVGRRPAAVSPDGVSGEHSGLSERVHRALVARAADAARSVYGVRRVRALLPGGRDHAGRRRDVRRLLLLQGLRCLRGRLPGTRRRLDGSGARVSRPLPQGQAVMTSNEAVAYAVVLARAQAIGCYPITPQTLIVERLAELTVGRDDVEFANLESEHSMFGYVIAAARAGVRAFTATSSQGLLYAHEQLHRASRERVPLVAVNVNRAVLAPWSLEPDLADSMSQRDTGWIQLYCSSGQEVLDTVLCAYRIAEEAMLPVLVCAEGFLLSHTSEVVDVPSQEEVDRFLPPTSPPPDWLIDPMEPRTYAAVAQPDEYYAFQRNVAAALDEARHSIGEVAGVFAAQFGRAKV